MTDKQIIIDGVDVSGCEYYCERYCKQVVAEDGCYVFLCAEDENCHYKKWQRKEQECEELKRLLKVRIEDLCDSCGASSMKLMPCKVYEKTLTEIKEIAEAHKKDESVWNPYRQLDKILQKISEVEDVSSSS